ncbi:AAA domain protein [Schaalia georgiae F0490]|uniref:AAA domain protein n=1 Tax=Schaalia georgiae F0490 TaxID=1125717 RepID=J0NPX7_9ACTO|nr:hypothetical protein [Schaalia georgiae]EJF46857.1 AAA domain protein [Schaalia georgiae F0490]
MTAPRATVPAVARALDALVRTRHARRPGAPLVLIDGLSGAGKSTLAAAVAPPGGPWRVLGLDSYYPGWDGLEEGSRETARIARDLAAGRDTHYTPWDWEAGRPLVPVPLPAGIPTVIEGCGALTPASRASADLAVWVEAGGGADQRRTRALARDGDVYAPHWYRWAAQDGARDGARLADLVVRT